MKHKDLAAAYGLSIETVRRWPATKRAAAIADIEAGVVPPIADLVAELTKACYRASCYMKTSVSFTWYFGEHKSWFNVFHNTGYGTPLVYIVDDADLTAINLSDAIAKVEELCI